MTGPFQFDAIFNLLLLVTVITLIAKRLHFPYTIALIVAGLSSTLIPRFPISIDIGSEVFTSLLLPPIIFQETLHLDIEGLIDDSDTILGYAVAGTLFMVVAVALFSFFLLGFSPIEAFLLGVIIAPTDPVAVCATFRSLGVIKRFQLLVSGESLFNDGVAIVIYSIIVSIIRMGTITVSDVAKISIVSVVGGILLGVAAGYIVHILFCWTDDKFAEVMISFIAAFGVFRIAEELGASGVIATVLTGLIINYRTTNFGGLGDSKDMLDALWEFVGFTASSIAFIFIGVNLDTEALTKYILSVAALTVFILVARYVMVEGIAMVIEKASGKRLPTNWRRGIFWSGLRGAVSVVLALGVDSLNLSHGEGLKALTFGVVLATNFIQGLSMGEVVQRLRLTPARRVISSEPIVPDDSSA